MADKILLLNSSTSPILVSHKVKKSFWYNIVCAIGALMVLMGAANMCSYMAERFLGPDAPMMLFGPAAALQSIE